MADLAQAIVNQMNVATGEKKLGDMPWNGPGNTSSVLTSQGDKNMFGFVRRIYEYCNCFANIGL